MPAFAYKYELNICLELRMTDCVAVVYLAKNTKPYLNCFELAVICLIQSLPIPTPYPHAHICGMLYLQVYVDVKRVLLLCTMCQMVLLPYYLLLFYRIHVDVKISTNWGKNMKIE